MAPKEEIKKKNEKKYHNKQADNVLVVKKAVILQLYIEKEYASYLH